MFSSTSQDLLAFICLNCLNPVVDRSAVDVFVSKNSREARQGSEYPCLSSSWQLQQTFFCSFCLVLFLRGVVFPAFLVLMYQKHFQIRLILIMNLPSFIWKNVNRLYFAEPKPLIAMNFIWISSCCFQCNVNYIFLSS